MAVIYASIFRISVNVFFLADRGEVFGFGAGNYGQLGTGYAINKTTLVPAKALAGKQINYIAAGPSHSIAISTDGKVLPDPFTKSVR